VPEEGTAQEGIINNYELSKEGTWGEAPYHKFHEYLVKRHNQQEQNFCFIAIREATNDAAEM